MPIDYKRYPADWKERRERILQRARYYCECDGECGAHDDICLAHYWEENPRTGSTVILTIAHLDHDESNHDVSDDRLKAMCQACHLAYDAKEKARRRKYGTLEGQLELEEYQHEKE